MKRRGFVGAAAACTSALLVPATLAAGAQAPAAPEGGVVAEPQSWSPPAHVTPGEVPVPAGVRVARGYADTPLGQVHYQDVGRGPVVVLLHQVPWFYIYYTRAQAQFAARGFRTIAIDTPGYGLSARLEKPPAIADYAVAIDAVLAQLKVRRAIVVGHHTGSTIGVELAKSFPRRVQCLVMHGVPIYTEAEAKARLDAGHWDQRYRTDGSHLTDRWMYLGGRITGSPDSQQWSVLSIYISGEKEWYGHHAVFRYDMRSSLAALKLPVVVINDGVDMLGYTVARVRELRPEFTVIEAPGRSSNMPFDEPQAWVDAVLRGASTACSERAGS